MEQNVETPVSGNLHGFGEIFFKTVLHEKGCAC